MASRRLFVLTEKCLWYDHTLSSFSVVTLNSRRYTCISISIPLTLMIIDDAHYDRTSLQCSFWLFKMPSITLGISLTFIWKLSTYDVEVFHKESYYLIERKKIFAWGIRSNHFISVYTAKIEMQSYIIYARCVYSYRKCFDNARVSAFIVRVLFGGRPLVQC